MDRRSFVKSLAALGLTCCGGGCRSKVSAPEPGPIWNWGPVPGPTITRVGQFPAVVGTAHAEDSRSLNVESLVRSAVEQAGGFAQSIQRGDTVVIKPNLIYNVPSGVGLTTDVRVAEAVAKLCLDCGAKKIIFAEGSALALPVEKFGLWSRDRTGVCFAAAGYEDLAKKLGATLLDLNQASPDGQGMQFVREVKLAQGLARKSYWIRKEFLDADRIISVPVLKNHTIAGITFSLKNYVGIAPADIYRGNQALPGADGVACLPGKLGLDHSFLGLARTIVDLVMIRPPDYVVGDALIGANTGETLQPVLPGPKGPMQAIFAGRDPVAIDTAVCLAVNFHPASIGHIVLASAMGLGTADPAVIRFAGAGIEPFSQDFQIPPNNYYTPARYLPRS